MRQEVASGAVGSKDHPACARLTLAGRIRRQTAEHVFGTLKSRMGATHFLIKTLPKVKSELSLDVLAYNLKRMIQILGVQPLIAAIRA